MVFIFIEFYPERLFISRIKQIRGMSLKPDTNFIINYTINGYMTGDIITGFITLMERIEKISLIEMKAHLKDMRLVKYLITRIMTAWFSLNKNSRKLDKIIIFEYKRSPFYIIHYFSNVTETR